jgi:hypothetical protein
MPSPIFCARSTSRTSRSHAGASFRGLHDSLVNYLGNTRPELLLCVHEENGGRARARLTRASPVVRSRWRCTRTSG